MNPKGDPKMASLTTASNGRRAIYVRCPDGKRRPIRLGKIAKRQAETIKHHIEELSAASIGGYAPTNHTVRWLREIKSELYDRLAALGLVEPRERATLKAFIEAYITERHDVKPNTVTVYKRTKRHLLGHFPAEKPLRSFTAGDADAFRLYLIGQPADTALPDHQTGGFKALAEDVAEPAKYPRDRAR
jgi:hypothetical protein